MVTDKQILDVLEEVIAAFYQGEEIPTAEIHTRSGVQVGILSEELQDALTELLNLKEELEDSYDG